MDLPKVFGADYLDQDVLDGFLRDCSSLKDLTISGQFRAGHSVQTLTQEEHALTPTVDYLHVNAPSVEKLQLRLRPNWWRGGFKILVNSRNLKTFTFSSGAGYAFYSRDETYGWADGFWRGYGFHVYRCIIGSSSTTFYGEVEERPDARDMPFYFDNNPRFKFPVRLRVHLEEDFKGGAWLFYLLGCFQRLTDVNIMKDLPPEHDLIIPEVRDPENAHDGFKWCTERIVFEDFDLESGDEERVLRWLLRFGFSLVEFEVQLTRLPRSPEEHDLVFRYGRHTNIMLEGRRPVKFC